MTSTVRTLATQRMVVAAVPVTSMVSARVVLSTPAVASHATTSRIRTSTGFSCMVKPAPAFLTAPRSRKAAELPVEVRPTTNASNAHVAPVGTRIC